MKAKKSYIIAAALCASFCIISCKDSGSGNSSLLLLLGYKQPAAGDSTAPVVSSVSPVNDTVEVPLGSNIVVNFSEAMDELTVTGASFTLSDGSATIGAAAGCSGSQATLNPTSDLAAGKVYTAKVTTDVTDAAGNHLASNYSWAFSTLPAHGYRDASFSGDGMVTTNISSTANGIADIAIQSDGKIVAGGYSGPEGSRVFALARYNTDGSLDTGFGTIGIVTTSMGSLCDGVKGIAIQPDGKIVAVGQAIDPAGTSGNMNFAVARYNTNGSLDTGFSTDGKVYIEITSERNCYAYDVDIDGSDHIVVAGYVLSDASGMDIAVAKLSSTGALYTIFGTNGKVVTDIAGMNDCAYSVAVHKDAADPTNIGKIVVAGYATVAANTEYFALVRYNANGTLDTGFSSDGIVTTNVGTGNRRAFKVIIPSGGSGSILAGGGSGDFSLVKYTSSGALDTTFSSDGMVVTDLGGSETGSSLAVDSSGNIIQAGTSSSRFAMIRYTSTGTVDTTFGVSGIVKTPFATGGAGATAIAIQSDGDIILAGSANNGTDYDFALVRYIE